MEKTLQKQRSNRLNLTRHARERLTSRQLWPALRDISKICYDQNAPRYFDRSTSGRPVQRIEVDGVVLIIAGDPGRQVLTLVTVHSGSESGARACARIAQISQNLGKKVAA